MNGDINGAAFSSPVYLNKNPLERSICTTGELSRCLRIKHNKNNIATTEAAILIS